MKSFRQTKQHMVVIVAIVIREGKCSLFVSSNLGVLGVPAEKGQTRQCWPRSTHGLQWTRESPKI